ncbi:MAG: hypothetical protein MJ223_01330 [Mycoplasmoidaceae bacterium]|nr:hypothetical protein [Mycoplasmoidaceae bacterium]
MRKIIKMLIPSLSLLATASCSCVVRDNDGCITLDNHYFDIQDNVLKGFKQEYQSKESIGDDSYKLSVFKDITSIESGAFLFNEPEQDSIELIKKIDFIANCACTSFGETNFSGAANLEKVILPPKFNYFGPNLFTSCPKLTTIDLRYIEQEVSCTSWSAPDLDGFSSSGTIIYKKDNNYQKALASFLSGEISKSGKATS